MKSEKNVNVMLISKRKFLKIIRKLKKLLIEIEKNQIKNILRFIKNKKLEI